MRIMIKPHRVLLRLYGAQVGESTTCLELGHPERIRAYNEDADWYALDCLGREDSGSGRLRGW